MRWFNLENEGDLNKEGQVCSKRLTEGLAGAGRYVSGTLEVPPTAFMVFLYDESGSARPFNLLDTSQANISAFVQACEAIPSFHAHDDDWRQYRSLEGSSFATSFVPERTEMLDIVRQWMLHGLDAKRELKMVLKELRVYGTDDFMERRWDDSAGQTLGSLVVTLPAAHEGGEIILHASEDEQDVAPSSTLSSSGSPRMAFAAYKHSVRSEVTPIIDGHRIILHYELRYADAPKASPPNSVLSHQIDWASRLRGLLDNKTFLMDGGLLCFGLQHSYDVSGDDEYGSLKFEPKALEGQLKGIDLQVFRLLHNLGLKPELQLSYDGVFKEGVDPEYSLPCPTRGLASQPVDLLKVSGSSKRTLSQVLKTEGTLAKEGLEADQAVWVTPVTENTYTRQICATPEDKATWVSYVRANMCIVARVNSEWDRIRRLKKRKRPANEGSDAEAASAKRKMVRFREETEEIDIKLYEPCEAC